MKESLERRILKKLYVSYRKDQKVSKFPAADIFREFSIANGTDLSPIYKSDFLGIDERENFYITDKGIKYMDGVFARYEALAGLIKDNTLVNQDKENRAFVLVDRDIEDKRKTGFYPHKLWYEKPWGIILMGVVVAVIAGGILFFLEWN